MDIGTFLEQVSEAVKHSWAGPKIFWQYFAASLLFLAVVLGVIYRRTLFSELKKPGRRKKEKPAPGFIQTEDSVLEKLIEKKMILSIHLDDGTNKPLGQCVLSGVDHGLLRCDLTAGAETMRTVPPGTDIICFFGKISIDGEPVNNLKTALHSLTSSASLIFEKPDSYGFFHRRQDKRKKILSQAYIRLNLWRFDPETGPEKYLKAPPAISVNSYLAPSQAHLETRVANISSGGLAVLVPLELSERLRIGMDLALNLNLFSARKKIFTTSWITARIRSVAPAGGGSARIGMEFMGKIRK